MGTRTATRRGIEEEQVVFIGTRSRAGVTGQTFCQGRSYHGAVGPVHFLHRAEQSLVSASRGNCPPEREILIQCLYLLGLAAAFWSVYKLGWGVTAFAGVLVVAHRIIGGGLEIVWAYAA